MAEKKGDNGKLVWNPITDQRFETINMTCEIEEESPTQIINAEKQKDDGTSEFYKQETKTYRFKNCKPTTKTVIDPKNPLQKKTVTIDTNSRLWLEDIHIKRSQNIQKLDPTDKSLDPQLRVDLFTARLDTLTNLLVNPPSDAKKTEWLKEQEKATQIIEEIKKQKELGITKKIFVGTQ